MINLLPSEDKILIRNEYLGRIALVFGAFFSFAFLAGMVVLLPTFYLFSSHEKNLDGQVSVSEGKIKKLDVEQNSAEIKKIIERLNLINSPNFNFRLNELFKEIISLKSDGVKITSISFDVQKSKNSSEAKVSLSGKASVREDLLKFIDRLKKNYGDQRVKSPITNLISDKDTAFSLTITLPNEKQ